MLAAYPRDRAGGEPRPATLLDRVATLDRGERRRRPLDRICRRLQRHGGPGRRAWRRARRRARRRPGGAQAPGAGRPASRTRPASESSSFERTSTRWTRLPRARSPPTSPRSRGLRRVLSDGNLFPAADPAKSHPLHRRAGGPPRRRSRRPRNAGSNSRCCARRWEAEDADGGDPGRAADLAGLEPGGGRTRRSAAATGSATSPTPSTSCAGSRPWPRLRTTTPDIGLGWG